MTQIAEGPNQVSGSDFRKPPASYQAFAAAGVTDVLENLAQAGLGSGSETIAVPASQHEREWAGREPSENSV